MSVLLSFALSERREYLERDIDQLSEKGVFLANVYEIIGAVFLLAGNEKAEGGTVLLVYSLFFMRPEAWINLKLSLIQAAPRRYYLRVEPAGRASACRCWVWAFSLPYRR